MKTQIIFSSRPPDLVLKVTGLVVHGLVDAAEVALRDAVDDGIAFFEGLFWHFLHDLNLKNIIQITFKSANHWWGSGGSTGSSWNFGSPERC